MKKMSNNKNESVYSFVVLGEPASKSNSRRLVTIKGRPAFIKSKKAIDYVKNFQKQCPAVNPLMEGYIEVEMTVYYATRRPDLDESVILDCMQDKMVNKQVQPQSRDGSSSHKKTPSRRGGLSVSEEPTCEKSLGNIPHG